MTIRNRKVGFWVFKLLGIIVACAFPIIAIVEKFPVWTETHGAAHSIGVGAILILIVVAIIFRKTVFNFIRDRLNLKHAPPLVVWLVLLIISYILVFIGEFMLDMTTILWMGLIGSILGTIFTYISEKFSTKGEKSNE